MATTENWTSNVAYSFSLSTGLSSERAMALLDTLRQALVQIQKGNSAYLRYEELYRHAHTLVAHRYGDRLYAAVCDVFAARVAEIKDTITVALGTDSVLETLVSEWEAYHASSILIRDVMLYLDRTFVKSAGVDPIEEVALATFTNAIISSPHIGGPVRSQLLLLIRRDRDAFAATGRSAASDRQLALARRPLIRRCTALYIGLAPSLSVYHSELKLYFLRASQTYYEDVRRRLLAQHAGPTTVPAYLEAVETRLVEEDERVRELLGRGTSASLRVVLQDELIVKAASDIINNPVSGLVPMLTQAQLPHLARLYRVFSREPAELLSVGNAMAKLVRETGEDIVTDAENPRNPARFIERLLRLQEHYARIITQAFKGDRNFLRLLREAIEQLLNSSRETATYLSLYIDAVFRIAAGRGAPAGAGATTTPDACLPAALGRPAIFTQSLPAQLSRQELEHRICGILFVFRHFTEKDLFEEVFKQHLAGRLLTGSADIELERALLTRLKTECGHQFTAHFEGMLRDMSASSLVARDYKSVRRGAQADTLEPTVLTTGFWPLQPQPCCQLPPAAQAAADAFTGYYTNKHSARRLQWQAQLGTAVLSVQFNEGVKELLVPSYQMVILLQYGPDRNSFTFDQLTKMTTIPDTELRRHLLSLAHPKSRILIKTPNVAAISASDSFALNLAFSSPSVRVVTPVLSLASVEALRSSAGGAVSGTGTSGGMDSAATQAVMERRKHEIDSAITRILKQRKTMSHTDLVSAVGQALASRFAIDTAFVKKRIEYLISHEYVERDTNDRSVYHYKA